MFVQIALEKHLHFKIRGEKDPVFFFIFWMCGLVDRSLVVLAGTSHSGCVYGIYFQNHPPSLRGNGKG